MGLRQKLDGSQKGPPSHLLNDPYLPKPYPACSVTTTLYFWIEKDLIDS